MADRYWVGGSGNWSDNTNHWAATSGGAPGAALPTAADNVIFDTLSNATAYTCTIDATTKLCLDITFGAPLVGDMTWAGSVAMTISGSMTLYATLVRTYTGALTFNATDSRTITTAGITTNSTLTFNGSGGTWTLQDNWNNSSKNITLTQGTLDTNGKTVTFGAFTGTGSSTRVLTLGASTLTMSGNWDFSGSNQTLNAGTSNIAITKSALDFTGGAKTYATVTIVGTGDITAGVSLLDGNTYGTLNISTTGAVNPFIMLSANQTVTGTLTLTGAGAGQGMNLVRPDTSSVGTVRTITAATTSLTNNNFMDITGAGAAAWTGTQMGDCGGNSGITFDAPKSRYWVGGTGSWSATTEWAASSGGASGASIPLPQDEIIFDANSFTAGGQTATLNMFCAGKNINFTGVTNSPTFTINSTGGAAMFGSLTLVSGMTLTQTTALYFGGRGSFNITSAGKTFGSGALGDVYTLFCVGGTYTLLDNFVGTRDFIIRDGTLDANDFNITANLFSLSSVTRTRAITMGSGNWTATGTGTVWSAATSTGLTVNKETSTIVINDASATNKTIACDNLTYNNIYLTGAGTGEFRFTGSPTFNDFKCDTPPHTIAFTAGTTTTVSSFTVSGTSGNLMTIGSITAASHTLVKVGAERVNRDFLSISRSTATPADTWFAGSSSTDGGNNSGWIFANASTRSNFISLF